MKCRLTIAIPTYNRIEKLKQCLSNAILESVDKDVEILVSDNCSTDGTQAYMNKIIKENSRINYMRNKENLGPDRNFLNCFNNAQGEYILLLGDDDFLLPGSVKSILDCIEENPVFIHLNSSGIKKENNKIVCTTPRLKEEGIKRYKDKNLFMNDVGIYITFMSSLVIKNDYIKHIVNKERFIGTNFIQSYIALETLKNKGLYIINTYNCLASSPNITVSYDLYRVWGKSYSDLLSFAYSECDFSYDSIEKIRYYCFRTIIYDFVCNFRYRCKNSNTWNKQNIFECVNKYPDLRTKYHFIVNCPKWMLFIRNFGKQIFKKLKYFVAVLWT